MNCPRYQSLPAGPNALVLHDFTLTRHTIVVVIEVTCDTSDTLVALDVTAY